MKLKALLMLLLGLLASPALAQNQPPTPQGASVLAGTVPLSVTNTGQNAALPVTPGPSSNIVTYYNSGTKDAYCAPEATSGGLATTSSPPVRAGTVWTQWVGSNAYVSCITGGSDTTTVTAYQANGPIQFAVINSAGGGASGVTSFNTRTGAVTLSSSDVTTALTYTPINPANNGSDFASPSATLTNLGGTTLAAVKALNLGQFASTTSAQLYGVLSNPTGSGGSVVFATGPTIASPIFTGNPLAPSGVESSDTNGCNGTPTNDGTEGLNFGAIAGVGLGSSTGSGWPYINANNHGTALDWSPAGTTLNIYGCGNGPRYALVREDIGFTGTASSIAFQNFDSTSTRVTNANINNIIDNATHGAVASRLSFQADIAGTMTTAFSYGNNPNTSNTLGFWLASNVPFSRNATTLIDTSNNFWFQGSTAHGVMIGEGNAAGASTAVGTSGQCLTSNGNADPTYQACGTSVNKSIGGWSLVISGGGSPITTGVKYYGEVPYGCTINRATLEADQTGSIVVDIWDTAYVLNTPPTVANTITASALPTLSSARTYQDTTLTGWSKTITAGDIIAYNVNSASTVTQVTVSLACTKT